MQRIPELWNPVFVRQAAATFRSARAIARVVGCNKEAVHKALQRYGVKSKHASKATKTQPETRASIRREVLMGEPLRIVAKRYGLDNGTIRKLYTPRGRVRTANGAHIGKNHGSTQHGRARQERIRQCARLVLRGLPKPKAAEEMGVSWSTAQGMIASAYYAALTEYAWAGSASATRRYEIARQMAREGFDAECIMKALDIPKSAIPGMMWRNAANQEVTQ